jgi:hypothetical protein
MDPLVIGIIVVAAAVIGWLIWQQQRTRKLRSQYAIEYERTVGALGRRRGEAELRHRQARVRQLDIRPLGSTERDRFAADWRRVQEQFVDDPEGAVARGDQLVDDVMRARGYPIADFERQVADLSVDHPRVVENYRTARMIAVKHQRGSATTEELRQAMVLYRELFEDLLATPAPTEREREVIKTVEREGDAETLRTRSRATDFDREVRP